MTATTASQSCAVQTARPIASAAAMTTTAAGVARAGPIYADPLDDDESTDRMITTTCRAISRVALVASETASRFQREGLAHDPMTWMLAPRHLFGGASGLTAHLLALLVVSPIGRDAADPASASPS